MHVASDCNADRRTVNKVGLELSSLLHQWDPIGVYDADAPNLEPGEYDDLVVPLLDQLGQSSSPEVFARALEQVLADDYGLLQVSNVDVFAAPAA